MMDLHEIWYDRATNIIPPPPMMMMMMMIIIIIIMEGLYLPISLHVPSPKLLNGF
jgi:hypothetical protein